MKILILYNPKSGCCYHRSFLPFSNMQLHDGDQTTFRQYDDVLFDADFEVDIVFYNKMPYIPFANILRLKKKYGFKLVMDVDDYWELYPGHYLTNIWLRDRIPEHIITGLQNADLVTCTTHELRQDVLKYNKNCEVIPNALPIGVGQFHPIRIPSDVVRIIFAGGASHYWDILLIKSVFESLGSDKTLNNHFYFNLAGYEKTEIWDKILEIVKSCPHETNRYMPLNEYMNQYIFSDISIAPLDNNHFNTRKSNLKIIEAGCKSIPIVCSNMAPYLDKNPGIIKCSNTTEWTKALQSLIKDPMKRVELGMELNHYVKENYDLHTINKRRYDILMNLIKS